MEEFSHRPSAMPGIGVDLSGYATEGFARAVGETVNDGSFALEKSLV